MRNHNFSFMAATLLGALLFFSSIFPVFAQGEGLVAVHRQVRLMGSEFEFTVLAPNEEIGYTNIEEAIAEVARIEGLISSWDPNSTTAKINQNAGLQPVVVSPEYLRLVERCLQLSALSEGAFDITYARMSGLWAFGAGERYLPGPEALRRAVALGNYQDIRLDREAATVFLPETGMKIGFGAIGKGFAADRAKELLQRIGVPGGMINAGGDITAWGHKVTGEQWLIGIADPLCTGHIFNWVALEDSAVSITGLRERYLLVNGTKYRDIIDPRTGQPVMGISQVTVFSRSAEFTDALATAVFILGPEKGLDLVNQLEGTEAIIEDESGRLYQSLGLPRHIR